jgi:hypothetical protein
MVEMSVLASESTQNVYNRAIQMAVETLHDNYLDQVISFAHGLSSPDLQANIVSQLHRPILCTYLPHVVEIVVDDIANQVAITLPINLHKCDHNCLHTLLCLLKAVRSSLQKMVVPLCLLFNHMSCQAQLVAL